jgi:hypothetical protein
MLKFAEDIYYGSASILLRATNSFNSITDLKNAGFIVTDTEEVVIPKGTSFKILSDYYQGYTLEIFGEAIEFTAGEPITVILE